MVRISHQKRMTILAHLHLSGLTYAQVAKRYGVSYATVANINIRWGVPRGKGWKPTKSIAEVFGL